MPKRDEESMRSYWDERARLNAAWYVDTSLAYDDPDMERFFADGEKIVAFAFDDAPVSPAATERALEIGSGLGRICLALASRFERVTGVDISSEMIARARELVDEPRVDFVHGDGSSLEMADDASVDAVFSFTVFQHIPSIAVIERYITEAGRALRPGGTFVFQWNNEGGSLRWALVRRAKQLLRLRRDPHGRDDAAFLGSRVSRRRIEAALARGGMELAHTKHEGSLYAFAWAVKR